MNRSPVPFTARQTLVIEPRHPSQLYAAVLEGILLFAYIQWRFWRTQPRPGQISSEFLIGYGVVRIVGELFREPDAPLILGISRGQFYSIFMIFAGIVILRVASKQHLKNTT